MCTFFIIDICHIYLSFLLILPLLIYVVFFIQSPIQLIMDILVDSAFQLLHSASAHIMCQYLLDRMISCFLKIYSNVTLLERMTLTFLIFKEIFVLGSSWQHELILHPTALVSHILATPLLIQLPGYKQGAGSDDGPKS